MHIPAREKSQDMARGTEPYIYASEGTWLEVWREHHYTPKNTTNLRLDYLQFAPGASLPLRYNEEVSGAV